MGAQRTGTGFPGDLVLDAGALIALERGDEDTRGMLKSALSLGSRVLVPATALAQVWRGGPGSAVLARLLDGGEVDPLDAERARQVGVRLGQRRGSDVADAHAVCCAAESRATVATSDPDDLRALVAPGERLALIVV